MLTSNTHGAYTAKTRRTPGAPFSAGDWIVTLCGIGPGLQSTSSRPLANGVLHCPMAGHTDFSLSAPLAYFASAGEWGLREAAKQESQAHRGADRRPGSSHRSHRELIGCRFQIGLTTRSRACSLEGKESMMEHIKMGGMLQSIHHATGRRPPSQSN